VRHLRRLPIGHKSRVQRNKEQNLALSNATLNNAAASCVGKNRYPERQRFINMVSSTSFSGSMWSLPTFSCASAWRLLMSKDERLGGPWAARSRSSRPWWLSRRRGAPRRWRRRWRQPLSPTRVCARHGIHSGIDLEVSKRCIPTATVYSNRGSCMPEVTCK